MPNNKEYQDAYNKRYYQAFKEMIRGFYVPTSESRKERKPRKERAPKPVVVVEPYIEPERKEVIEIKTGNFLIEW
jgi:hypothetical protein